MELRTRDIDQFFDGLRQVYDEKERYSIEWAFEDAQKKMDVFKKDIIDDKLKSKCSLCKNNSTVLNDLDGLQKISRGIIRKSKLYARLFSNMYSLLSIVEILISFLLVMGLSGISHSSAEFIDSKMFSLIFAGTFAFLKVIIERNWVKPIVEKWGWSLYERSISRLREMTLALNYEATLNKKRNTSNEFHYEPTHSINGDEALQTSLLT